MRKTPHKWTLNERVFDSVDTADKAYWLGFLFADGGLDKGGRMVRVKQKGRAILEQFRDFLDSDFPINAVTHSSPSGKVCAGWQIAVYSAELWRALNALGCTPRKTSTKRFPSIAFHLERPFIAGYLDGNGWIGRRANSTTLIGYITTGSAQFMQDLSERLGVSWHKQTNGNTYRLRLSVGHILDLLPYSRKIQEYEVP